MKHLFVFGVGMIIFSAVYSANPAGSMGVSTEPIVRKCSILAKPMPSVLSQHPNAAVITNCGVICVRVADGKECREYHYSQTGATFPKMCKVRDEDGLGFDTVIDGQGRPTKYIEYKNGQIHGLWLEFHTNSVIRVYMSLTNDCLVGRQLFYDESGKLISEGRGKGSILDFTVK